MGRSLRGRYTVGRRDALGDFSADPKGAGCCRGHLCHLRIIWGLGASSVHGEPRHTNDIDFVTNLNGPRVRRFLEALGEGFYFDLESAEEALRYGRSFNIIHQKLGYKFDFFPVVDRHGDSELGRR